MSGPSRAAQRRPGAPRPHLILELSCLSAAAFCTPPHSSKDAGQARRRIGPGFPRCKAASPLHPAAPLASASLAMVQAHLAPEDSAHGAQAAAAAIKQANGAAAAGACGPPPAEPPLVPGTPEWDLHLPVADIHEHDKGTKDDWVPRWVLPPGRGQA